MSTHDLAAGAIQIDDSAAPASSQKSAPRLLSFHKHRNAPAPWANSMTRRCFDVALASLGLICASPLLLAAAAAIRLTSAGPAFYRQQRVGRGNRDFTIYKLRTMVDGADRIGPSVTSKDDTRTTPVGRWLRRYKLDEIPQLFNVLLGDMSFVGPRPKLAGHEHMHMVCRPGITGAATLLFSREEELLTGIAPDLVEQYTIDVLNPIKAKLDMQYAHRCTLRTDVQLIFATVFRIGMTAHMLDLADLIETEEQPAA